MKAGQKLQKSNETKEKVFGSALSLFKKKGFEETTMRDIAKEANIALGTTYYYFSSKDDIVSRFYEIRTEEILEHVYKDLDKNRRFEDRYTMYVNQLIQSFEPYKPIVRVLVRNGVDPGNINSPFNQATQEIRSKSIKLIKECIEGSTLKYDVSVKDHLAIFYWFLLLSIFFFWSFDNSKNNSRTQLLFNTTLKLSLVLIKLGRLPVLKGFQTSAVNLLESLWSKDEIYMESI